MKCEVIRDLIPSYANGLCSEYTQEIMQEHFGNCDECKNIYESIIIAKDNAAVKTEENHSSLHTIFHKIGKSIRRRRQGIILTAILVAFTLTAGAAYFMLQHVGSIHSIFFPEQKLVINKVGDEWEEIDSDILFNSIFYEKSLVNDANSVGPLNIKVVDERDNVIVGPFSVNPGEAYSLKELQNDKTYQLQISAVQGKYFVNIN